MEKGPMHPRVFGQLGVEGCGHHASLPDGDGFISLGGDDFNASSDALDLGSPDENHLER
jgi:hypothetical protein